MHGKASGTIWTGRVMTGLFVLFMALDCGMKLIGRPEVAETLSQLGWPADAGFAIGVLELVILLLYLFPPTAVLGAVLLTGLLGGAMATHFRVGSPLFSHSLFGVYVGLLAWGGLWLRDPRLRAIFPWRR